MLLDKGASPKPGLGYISKKVKMTELHWAAFQGGEEVVRALLDAGAEMSMDRYDNTPVDIAGYTGQKDVVRAFCEDLVRDLADEKPVIC